MPTLEKHEVRGGLWKVAVRLHRADFDYLRETFPGNYNYQLRQIIAEWVDRHRSVNDVENC